jgi:hypothetical protein
MGRFLYLKLIVNSYKKEQGGLLMFMLVEAHSSTEALGQKKNIFDCMAAELVFYII